MENECVCRAKIHGIEYEIYFLHDHENKDNYNKHKKYKITI
jgi:hypothetical protein